MMETEIMVGSGMKLTCNRDEFVSRLGVVSRAVSTRSSVQILAGVLLRAEAGELHLAATDMELSLRASLEAQVEAEGPVVVPGRLLVDLARLLPEPELHIEHRPDEAAVHITCGSAGYRLHTYSAEDFPRLPALDAGQLFSVDSEALLETVAQVSRAASRDESRPVLTGILARFERSSRRARSPSSPGSQARPRSSSSACRRTRSRSARAMRCSRRGGSTGSSRT
jgi:DNA polymerase-3 subunit beta